jgi:nucleoside-diphosphate-sugar epimerase
VHHLLALQVVLRSSLLVLPASQHCAGFVDSTSLLLWPPQTRSFQYVDDLIRGMVAVMEGDEIGPFNVGNPGEFTMLDLAEVSLHGAAAGLHAPAPACWSLLPANNGC